MKSEIINSFLNATINVVSTMAMLTPKAGKPCIKKDKKAVGDISGIIGLTGYSKGVVILSFSTKAICAIVGSMLGEEYSDLTPDVSDAVGELTNMISGDARRELEKLGYRFEAGLPTIVSGKGHEIESVTSSPVIAIPFKVNGHDFVVETSFDN